MAIRARSDNLSLDVPAMPESAAAPVADFAEVWAQREALRQACLRMIGDPARAEDLVQDTFMSALKCRGRLNEGQPVAPWLKTVARRRSIDELRGRDRVALMADPPEPWGVSVEDPADHVVSQELVDQLRSAIAELSVRERQLLLRQASYGLSLAELAAEEQTSIASVRSVLARARQKLRTSLERGGVFGVLPLPRYLVTLRERVLRWGMQLEPTLPSMTGAGARFGEAFAAVVTAIVMFFVGGGLPSAPDSSVEATGFAVSDQGGAGGTTGPATGGGGGTPNVSGRAGPPPGRSSAIVPDDPLPPEIGDAPIPSDKIGYTAPEEMRIESMAVSTDGDVILLSGYQGDESVLFRSTDSGHTWTRHSDHNVHGLYGSKTFPGGDLYLAPDFPTDPRIWVVSLTGIYRSDDAGKTFEPVAAGSRPSVMSPNFADGDERLFVAGPLPAEYDELKNETRPFSLTPMGAPVGEPIGIDVAPDFATTGEVLVGGTTGTGNARTATVYTCDPAGCGHRATLPNYTYPTRLLTARSSPGTVFAWSKFYFARSTDGGHTFVPTPVSPEFGPQGMRETGGAIYWFGNNPWRTKAPIYRSADGGSTWDPLGLGSPLEIGAGDVLALPNGRLLAAHTSSGIFCSVDDGLTWAERCPPP